MTSDPKETSVTIQDVDRESRIFIEKDKNDPFWAAQEKQLLIPASNFNLICGMRLTGTLIEIFARVVGFLPTLKFLKKARETCDLEAEKDEGPKEPDIGRVMFQLAK